MNKMWFLLFFAISIKLNPVTIESKVQKLIIFPKYKSFLNLFFFFLI